MALPTFPFSPLPAEMTREIDWNEYTTKYDSGVQQGFTNYSRPMYNYTIPIKLMTDAKQSSLWSFFRDTVKGMTSPFLMKDPYDNSTGPLIIVGSTTVSGASMTITESHGYFMRVDTTTIASMNSVASGTVLLGTHYNYDLDTGVLMVNTKAVNDVWTVGSLSYWRKVKMDKSYKEKMILWGLFSIDALTFVELP